MRLWSVRQLGEQIRPRRGLMPGPHLTRHRQGAGALNHRLMPGTKSAVSRAPLKKSQSRASAPAIRQQRLHVDGRFIPHLLQCGAQDRAQHQQQTSMSPSGRNLARALNLAKASTACSGAGMPSSGSFTIEDLHHKQGSPRGHYAAYHSDGRDDMMRSDRGNTTPQRSHVIQTAGSTTWLADAAGYRRASRQQDLGTGCTEMAKTAICWSCLACCSACFLPSWLPARCGNGMVAPRTATLGDCPCVGYVHVCEFGCGGRI